MTSKDNPKFSESKRCGHCGNVAPMKIAAEYQDLDSFGDDGEGGCEWAEGNIYELLKCPACGDIELRKHFYHSSMGDEPLTYARLYPVSSKIPSGLPPKIRQEYEAALKVRGVSPNAYGVLMGRVLELVCEDRKAKGATFYKKLADLAAKNEIPTNLLPVADKLRVFRNVGAVALGELTENEAPILDNLSRAILEYVYSAPHLVEVARVALEKLHKRNNRRRSGK